MFDCSTELVVQQKRRNIEDLKLRIIDEEHKQSTNLSVVWCVVYYSTVLYSADFEAEMAQLADNFREAGQLYVSR